MTSEAKKIDFGRDINLFLPDKKCLTPSDYQFLSFFDHNQTFQSNDKIEFSKDFKNYLRRDDTSEGNETSYNPRLFFGSFFFKVQEYIETDFEAFLLCFFKIICPDDLSFLNEKSIVNYKYLEEYNKKFIPPNEKFNKKALYFWLSLGFERSDYYPSLIPKESTKFNMEKVSVLHNLCYFFSCKLYFVYFQTDSGSHLRIMPAGLINSENIVLIGLRYDKIKNKKAYHLTLSKPQSVELDQEFIDANLSPEPKDFQLPVREAKCIYNLHFAQSCLLDNTEVIQDGNLFDQMFKRKFNATEAINGGIELNLTNHTKEVTTNDFIFPIFDSEQKVAKLFSIIANSNETIIDTCFNDTSVYVLSRYTNEHDGNTYIKVFEGSIGDQFLDDMYLCWEEKIKIKYSGYIWGKVSLKKGNRVSTPIAIIIYKDDDDYYNVLIYKKPQSKPLPNESISNNYYYPSSLQYYTAWELFRNEKPDRFEISKEFNQVDFDGKNIIFMNDKTVIRTIDLDQYHNGTQFGEAYKSNDEIAEINNYNTNNEIDDAIFEIDKSVNYLIGIEINNLFFLLANKKENIYYHPAKNNFYLKAAIKSAFFRYKEKMLKNTFGLKEDGPMAFGEIVALIDIGYNGDINTIFGSNPIIPGIYLKLFKEGNQIKKQDDDENDGKSGKGGRTTRGGRAGRGRRGRRETDDSDDDDSDEDEFRTMDKKDKKGKNTNKGGDTQKDEVLYTFNVAFGNAGMMIGKDVHRTKCQLAAAYSTSTKFNTYGPALKEFNYVPESEVLDNWTLAKAKEMLANLVATYSVLLEMKSDVEFNIALNTLKTTKTIRKEFYEFYEVFKKNWDNY